MVFETEVEKYIAPFNIKPNCLIVAPRKVGTRQKHTCSGSFIFRAKRCAYNNAQLSLKKKFVNCTIKYFQSLLLRCYRNNTLYSLFT